MSRRDPSMRLGEVLRDARNREGLEITDVERTTKIRIKYLRALEAEEWDQLPSPAYAKGFLRTYAQLLGLDGDALVDEFRRQVEVGPDDQPFGPQASTRRRATPNPATQGPPPMFPPIVPIAVGLVVLAAVVFAIIGLLGDSGEESGGEPTKQEQRAERREAREARAAEDGVVLAIERDTAVCLLDETPEPLVDGSVQPEGEELGPFDAERLTLRFPEGFAAGDAELTVRGEPADLEPESGDGPAQYRIEGRSVERIDPPPASCP
ncbi:helix-turn-helix domain-containing protein [Thermoleophilia bacterium SCSIO 60948]|nr:helix-turn-helix domain-containing protein [Thermoleophilia bacterium SCSIO 60948]